MTSFDNPPPITGGAVETVEGTIDTVKPTAEPNTTVDFFGGSEATAKWYFPGQDVQYIEYNIMTEGQRKQFQKKTSRDLKVNQKTRDVQFGVDTAGDREALLLATCIDWYIIDNSKNGDGRPVPFGKRGENSSFISWMNRANPILIDKLELAIRDSNPWMQDEMDPESIQEEIDRLEKLKLDAIKRVQERENLSS